MQRLAAQYGLTLVDLLQAASPGSEDTLYFAGQYYAESQADSDFTPVFRSGTAAGRGPA